MTAPARITPQYELYRVILDYEALHEGFIDRIEDLDVTRRSIDVAGKFTPGYSAKLLCNPPIKLLGKESLGKMLKATGLALVLVIDDERFAPVKLNLEKRKRPSVHPKGSIARPTWLFTRSKSLKMQVLRNKALSPRQRKMIAKRAARARWGKPKPSGALLSPAGSAPCADGQSTPIA
jgi:hypothetical protein